MSLELDRMIKLVNFSEATIFILYINNQIFIGHHNIIVVTMVVTIPTNFKTLREVLRLSNL